MINWLIGLVCYLVTFLLITRRKKNLDRHIERYLDSLVLTKPLIGYMIIWFDGYLVTWLLGYMVTGLYGYLVAWFDGYLVTWLHGYLAA